MKTEIVSDGKERHLVKTKMLPNIFISVGVLFALTRLLAADTIITFDAPGAGIASGQGTVLSSITPGGAIAGYYADAGNVHHGFFLSALGGTFTSFDAPGAGIVGQFQFRGTFAYGINPQGAIAGYYGDTSGVPHGYVRDPDGTITTFDVLGAARTFAYDINPAGMIAGYYRVGVTLHGYVRDPGGTITTFDAPGAGTGFRQGTFVTPFGAINPDGAIAGYYLDAGNVPHGYVRDPGGTITTFDVPGAGTGSFQGTQGISINPAGVITGEYVDSNNVNHGYVRASDGTITKFDIAGAGAGFNQGTQPTAINPAGAIAGHYVDSNNANHGFVRANDGTITTFDAPDASKGSGQGTLPTWINPAGTIVGLSIDSNGVGHGFLRTP